MHTTCGRPRSRLLGACALPVVLTLVLSGCAFDLSVESNDQPEPSPSLSSSPLPTDESPAPEGDAAGTGLGEFYDQDVTWEECRRSFQCATIEVPLDYDEPGARSISLSLIRRPADGPQQRVGSLVVNPGGPGASGVDFAANAGSYFGAELLRAFDVVGFDPRGVGRSTPVQCLDDDALDAFVAADPDPDNPAEVAEADRLVREFGEGCVAESGQLASHMSTVEAARDIDILRAVLGDPRLSYFGASYGTLLGATYADLFPDKVGRMVLDGAIDPSLSSVETSLVQARGFEVALRAYVQACVDRGGCFLGDTVDAGTKRIRQFLDEVENEPLPAGNGRQLEVGNAVLGIWAPLYDKDYWPTLDATLEAAFAGRGEFLMSLSDAYTSRGPDGYADNSLEALYAVNCLDHSEPISSEEVAALVPRFERASPTFGAIFAYGLSSCEQWPVKGDREPGPLTAEGAAPILVIGTSRDPATPLVWAEALAEQLASGVLVSRDGDGHTGYSSDNGCVDGAVESYLVSGDVPRDGLRC